MTVHSRSEEVMPSNFQLLLEMRTKRNSRTLVWGGIITALFGAIFFWLAANDEVQSWTLLNCAFAAICVGMTIMFQAGEGLIRPAAYEQETVSILSIGFVGRLLVVPLGTIVIVLLSIEQFGAPELLQELPRFTPSAFVTASLASLVVQVVLRAKKF